MKPLAAFMVAAFLLFAVVILVPVSIWAYTVPSGYTQIRSQLGVHLYQNGSEFVQVVQLDMGANVEMLHGSRSGSESFTRQSLQSIWSDFDSDPLAFAVCNGQYFRTNENPTTELAFSVKKDGALLTGGYGNTEYPGQKMSLKLWNTECIIEAASDAPDYLLQSSCTDGIVGLSETADKDRFSNRGRTFVGCADLNANNKYRTVLIYSVAESPGATQAHAAQQLRDFGAAQVVMLDGGGSSQMICQGQGYVNSSRTIPQSLGVLAAYFRCAFASQNPNQQIDLQRGQTAIFTVHFYNRGTDTWVNSGGYAAGNPSYVELWSVDSSGNQTNSFLYHAASWIDRVRVGPAVESAVGPGGVATFQFVGEVPTDASLGQHIVYFRPYHATAHFMDDWGGMHFIVNVVETPSNDPNLSFEYDLDSNGADYWDSSTVGGGIADTRAAGGTPAFGGCNPFGGAGIYHAELTNSSSPDWSACGHAISGPWGNLLEPDGTWYRMSFWYKVSGPVDFDCRLAKYGISMGSKAVGAEVTDAVDDGAWHRFIGSPFQVSADDLSDYPNLAFYLTYGQIGTVSIDSVQVLTSNACHP